MATQTVWSATYDLLRSLELTTVFGNPGSTEQPFLKNFPADFQYILGLQEASVVAMADGFAQATGRPALVNLHTSAGTGNGMGNIMTAFLNKTPLIITAGQQTREMILCDPLLTNRDETMLPQTLREVGLSAGARPGRAGRHHARIRHGAPTAFGPGVRIDPARRLGSACARPRGRPHSQRPLRARRRAPARIRQADLGFEEARPRLRAGDRAERRLGRRRRAGGEAQRACVPRADRRAPVVSRDASPVPGDAPDRHGAFGRPPQRL